MDNFSEAAQKTVIPEAVIPDVTEDSNLATDDDFDLATWFWSTIVEMYERAAEFDGCLAKPREKLCRLGKRNSFAAPGAWLQP